MESKKDIGKLFRENLEQLDYTPSTKVWEQLELDLEEKKKKRSFFIWFFLSTFIIVLVIGLACKYSDENAFTNELRNEHSISEEKTNKSKNVINTKEQNLEKHNSKNTIENINLNSIDDKKRNETILNFNTRKDKVSLKINSPIDNRHKLNQISARDLTTFKNKKRGKSKNNNSFVWKNSFKKNQKKSNKSITAGSKIESKETLLQSEEQIISAKNNTIGDIKEHTMIDSLIAKTPTRKISEKEKDSLTVKDSVADTQKKPKEYEIIIAPYYGFNYNGYFGDFNAISNNTIIEKKGAMRSAYGIMARWMFNHKFGIQLGVGKINNRYFSTIEKSSASFINTQNVDTESPISDINGRFVNATKVKFTYESSYIEVPLEAYYMVRDQKLGLATSFGVSLLFAGKNSIFAESEGIDKIKIGTLITNKSDGATINAKFYFFYKITPSLQWDLYPSFQYQIMGKTDSSNYSNYYFSLRTGFSYKL